MIQTLTTLNEEMIACRRCSRLVAWRELVAKEKRAAYRSEDYWGRPVPGFGDPNAQLLICGLAPGAHGANRTGRPFTGDSSGNWLYAALHRTGFANQPHALHREDGLELTNCYVTGCVRCAPPGNKPTIEERDNCLPYLRAELELLDHVQVIVCLGGFAWSGVARTLQQLGHATVARVRFSHGCEAVIGPYHVLGCYHPSQQNTFTGKLTKGMLNAVFRRVRTLLTRSTPRLTNRV